MDDANNQNNDRNIHTRSKIGDEGWGPGDTWIPIPHYAKPSKPYTQISNSVTWKMNKDEILNSVLEIVLLLYTTTSTLPPKPRSHQTLSR